MANSKDVSIVRDLAKRYMELANLPIMAERKRLWTALKDLRAERPMILMEVNNIEEVISDAELQCEEDNMRSLELSLRWSIRQVEEVGDDMVIEPVWKIGWHIRGTDYGVPIESRHAQEASIAYRFVNPIRTPADIEKLKPRTWSVNREATLAHKEKLENIFGDILPVKLHGSRGMNACLTSPLFQLLSMENMMMWMFDEPAALHRLMSYLRDDRRAYLHWMEKEKLLGLNNDSAEAGSGSPGFTTALPAPDYNGTARLKDIWVWVDSQETVAFAPKHFVEFFLPYMAEASKDFGLVYYGCCEPVHDRWEAIIKAIPQIRAVSISPWCDMPKMGEMLGKNYVFSRKPMPSYISGANPDWELLRKEVQDTLNAAKNCNLEFIFRDLYDLGGDRTRLKKWVEMVRGMM